MASQLAISGDVQRGVVIAGSGNKVYVYYERAEHVGTGVVSDADPGGVQPGLNPYKGLLYFEEADANRFFGREKLTEALYARLTGLLEAEEGQLRLLPVLGPSGSGKSSLVRAGLVPRLARDHLAQLVEPRVLVLTPGPHPLEALARALARVATGEAVREDKTDEFLGILSKRTDGLRRLVDALPTLGSARLMLIVDQFEELYVTPAAPKEREIFEVERDRFVAALLDAATDRGGRLFALTAMRSDFLGATQRHPELNAQIARWAFLVPGMVQEELEAAIRKPAEQVSPPYKFPTAFVDLLVNETLGRPGALPLLQFALQRVWDALPEDPAETLDKLGGLGGAVAAEAESVFGRLSPNDQATARRAFLAAVTLGEGAPDTRRRARLDEITTSATSADQDHSVLAKFSRPTARLITLGQEPGGAVTFEVTHETLIRRWDRLREWLDQGRDDQRFLHRAREAAELWLQNKGSLWRSFELEQLINFAQRVPQDMTASLTQFLKASLARRSSERRRQRTTFAATAAGLVIALALAGLASWQWSVAESAKQVANAQERIAVDQRSRAELSLGLATQTANGLVFGIAQQLRNTGVAATTISYILDLARKLQDQLTAAGETSPALRRSQAAALDETAITLLAVGNTDGALAAARQSRDIMQALVSSNHESIDWQIMLAVSDTNVGEALKAQGHLDEALAAYREGLEIIREFARKYPDYPGLQASQFTIDQKITAVLAVQGNIDEMMTTIRDGFAVLHGLSQRDPGNSQLLHDLLALEKTIDASPQASSDLNGMLIFYRDVLAVIKSAAAKDPGNTDLQHQLSAIENSIGDTLVHKGHLDDALVAYRDGHASIQELASKDPENAGWQHDLATSEVKIADVLMAQGHWDDALVHYNDALTIRKALALKDPGDTEWQHDLWVSTDKVGDLLQAQGHLDEALAAYRNAFATGKAVAPKDPSNLEWQHDLWVGAMRVADVLKAQGHFDDALAAYEDALGIVKALAVKDSSSSALWQSDLAATEEGIGDTLAAAGRHDEAIAAYRDSSAIGKKLAAADPADSQAQHELAVIQGKIGDVLAAAGRGEEALAIYNKVLAIIDKLAKADPGSAGFRYDLSLAQEKIGDLLVAAGNLEKALAAYQTSVTIRENLSNEDPANARWQLELAVGQGKIGDVLTAADRREEALAAYQKNLAILQKLSIADSENAHVQRELSESLLKVGDAKQQAGDLAGARAAYEEGLRLARQLYDRAPNADAKANLVQALGGLSFALIFNRLPQDAAACAEEALRLDPAAVWVETNRAHAYLFLGRFEQARSIYLENRDKLMDDGGNKKTFADAVKDDFAELRRHGIDTLDMAKIEALLTERPLTRPRS